jgi:hypothetical protein
MLEQVPKVYPEFEIYRRVGYWPIKAFIHLVLRTAADQYKKKLNNPNKKMSKAGRKQRKSTSPAVKKSTIANAKSLSGGESSGNPVDNETTGDPPVGSRGAGEQPVDSEDANEQHVNNEDAEEQPVNNETTDSKPGEAEIVESESIEDTSNIDLTMGSDIHLTIDEVVEGVSGMLLDQSSIRVDMSSILVDGKSHSSLHICAD